MKNKRCIYVLHHLARTAGYTFRYHIQKNLKPYEYINLSYALLGLDSQNPTLDSEEYQSAARNFLMSLSTARKRKVKIILGHVVPYGIHEYLPRPVRYFTFFRNPISRTISIYNQMVGNYMLARNNGLEVNFYKKMLLIDGGVPDFKDWLDNKYDSANLKGFLTIYGYLKIFGFINSKSKDFNVIRRELDKLYFIGTTKDFSRDSLYFYDKLNIRRYYFSKNASRKYFKLQGSEQAVRDILKRNELDMKLYIYAQQRRRLFIEANPNFYSIVRKRRTERQFKLLLTLPIETVRKVLF